MDTPKGLQGDTRMADVKIGLVGLKWGMAHVNTIGNLEGIRVAAVADNAPVKGDKMKVIRMWTHYE